MFPVEPAARSPGEIGEPIPQHVRIFDFSGDTTSFKGSLGANPPARPITSVAVLS